ncbi:MAG TPA: LysR family transcriptional regulator [Gammaproteobacteria bacterium]|nr:LysR family transcriptional regulator [Gammaproteobacteria bacterium]
MDNLTDLAVFVRVVELGSFTAAASALQISKAAVSKYVARLEQRLGARLLQRTTRRLTLTEAGDTLFRRGSAALSELADAESEVARLTGTPRGHLRVAAPVYFGESHVAPLLHKFRARYPDITLDLDFDNRFVDLIKERFDLALRITALEDSNLVARPLAPCPQVVCAAPAYLAKHGAPVSPADLRNHDCLSYSLDRTPKEWRFRSARGRWTAVNVNGPIRCNNDIALKQAMLDGLGLRQIPRFIVKSELDRGALVEVLADYESPPLNIYAVYATRRQLSPKVRVFVDFLVAEFHNGAWNTRLTVLPQA